MSNPVVVLKVALAGKKSIWRKIAMRANQTLDNLHQAVFDAFDRDDEHLYSMMTSREAIGFRRTACCTFLATPVSWRNLAYR